MKENLTKLYTTLLMIETKGENTKIMSDCLRFIEQLIAMAAQEETVNPETVEEEE